MTGTAAAWTSTGGSPPACGARQARRRLGRWV